MTNGNLFICGLNSYPRVIILTKSPACVAENHAIMSERNIIGKSKIYDISIIIPAHNEVNNITTAVNTSLNILRQIAPKSELIIAEDGSTDGTYEVAARIAADNSDVCVLHWDQRQGRGRALKQAIKASRGDVICYIDADLATDMGNLYLLLNSIRCDGYDIATGSRLMPNSDAKRSKKRLLASKAYNRMVSVLLNSKIRDHQCGFKAFNRSSLICILDEVEDEHWFWDTEILVRGQRRGFKIKEIPVRWQEGESTTVNLLKDSYDMLVKIIQLRRRLR